MTIVVGATQIKKWVCYGSVPALHIVVDVAIKCPSGLLSAYFLAHSSGTLFIIEFASCKALEKRLKTDQRLVVRSGTLWFCLALLIVVASVVRRRGDKR